MHISLLGRTALITGCTGHIGKTFAEELASHGANIAVLDRQQDSCEQYCKELSDKYGVRTMPVVCDLADDTKVHTVPAMVAEVLGGLDILINNAGFVGTDHLPGWCVPFEEQTTDTWRKVFEVNITACFTLCRESAPYLRKSGKGSIVNVGSIYGVSAPNMSLYTDISDMGNPVAYAASKGGLLQMTRWLSTVLAPDIRVNSMCPGGVWRNQNPRFVERYEAKTPMKRMATEDDMRGTMLYLASDMSLYVTGQNIMVDGGWSVW